VIYRLPTYYVNGAWFNVHVCMQNVSLVIEICSFGYLFRFHLHMNVSMKMGPCLCIGISTKRSTGIGFLVENLASAQFFFGLNRHERVRGKEKSTFARAGDLSYVTEPTFCQGLK
jgi:hypothetical protein